MKSVRAMRLYFVGGGSDKQHVLHIYERPDGGFELHCQHGKNGRPLSNPPGIKGPFKDQPTAEKALTSFVNGKTRDGYKIDTAFGDGDPAAGVSSLVGVKERTKSNIPIMLLREIDEFELESIIKSNAWALELKADGERTAAEVQADGTVMFVNKKSIATTAPAVLGKILGDLPVGTIVDGELMGDNTFILFDCLAIGTTDLKRTSEQQRKAILREDIWKVIACQDSIRLIPRAETEAEKRELVQLARDTNAEGVCGKRKDARHVDGRGDANSPAVKHRFVNGASCIVADVPAEGDTRSIGLAMLDANGNETPCGRVTIPPNKKVPALGAIVEINYRGANRGTNALWHPTYKDVRTDVDREECTLDTLRYRNPNAEAALAS